ncbi:hypothetical protein ONZ45_g19501 [Pleurotus djamor]|nr:hypothetical protein ONZ45_g19501 [Pleurotus djamor]
MIAHLIGRSPCRHASSQAKATARLEKGGPGESPGKSGGKRKRPEEDAGPTQTRLKVYKGISIPFGDEDIKLVQQQFIRATLSANLPFTWVSDPEVQKLLEMFRSAAADVIPSRDVLGGRLLNDEAKLVEETLKKELVDQYVVLASDGWKDIAKNAITGVNVSVRLKSYLVKLKISTGDPKDGEAMSQAFGEIIDDVEKEYKCLVVCFCTDNDGGSQAGRKQLIKARPWIFGPPCCAHQFQLILGDYFKVNTRGADVGGEATSVEEVNGKALAYIIANLTRWTTHYTSFRRLLDLKQPLRQAAILKQAEIVRVQVGAEKGAKAAKIKADAMKHCSLLDSGDFWTQLEMVVDDIEPICYGTNINQADNTRPDQVLLTFAGIWLHFSKHRDQSISTGMCERIEKRWKAMDQPLFVVALVLNPFEGLSRFGSNANANCFALNTLVIKLYSRIKNRPGPKAPTPEELEENKTAVSKAFLNYLSATGPFEAWDDASNQDAFRHAHGENPILMWEQYKMASETSELAEFAIIMLSMVVNQAGNERTFSDLGIKKSRLRNRLSLTKLEKMSKVNASIRATQKTKGWVPKRKRRENHTSARVEHLLDVPRHNIDDDGDDEVESDEETPLVKSTTSWRRELARWKTERQELDAPDENPVRPRATWLPRTLALLFGESKRPVQRPQRRSLDEESRQMELIAAEYEGEAPDDGALEGSGDEFEP